VEERRRAYRFEGRIALDRMIAGLVPSPEIGAQLHQLMASPMPGSWNHIVAWLKQIDAVRQAA
jgi:hypothetical protein